jgi:exopolyphosphatase/guanosine-5'-triphosphate,3'-diphosphate pyrophosphatase
VSAVVPRWEWRTFGEDFGPAEAQFAALTPENLQESDEIYVISTRGDASVKVRDALMDVKHLEKVNDDGLEQWITVLKS